MLYACTHAASQSKQFNATVLWHSRASVQCPVRQKWNSLKLMSVILITFSAAPEYMLTEDYTQHQRKRRVCHNDYQKCSPANQITNTMGPKTCVIHQVKRVNNHLFTALLYIKHRQLVSIRTHEHSSRDLITSVSCGLVPT